MKFLAHHAEKFLEYAREFFHEDGHVEFDGPKETDEATLAEVSSHDTLEQVRDAGGLYVRAWVWVEWEKVMDDEGELGLEEGFEDEEE